MTSAEIIAAARVVLKETATTIWDDTALGNYLTDVIRDISEKEPLKKYVNLPIIEYTTRIDISTLTSTMLKIIPQNEIEIPVGNPNYCRVMRDTEQIGSELNVLLDDVPTITDGTLTGTVTFTKDSRAVTGSGTAFDTELSYGVEGDLICLSTGTKYYQVAYVTSATALTLAEPFLETTATDTVNLTKYRANDSVARICYGIRYTVSTTSDMPIRMDGAAILGVAANAAMSYSFEKIRSHLTDISTKVTSAAAEAALANTSLDLAVVNIGTARTAYNTTNDTVIKACLTDAETALDACATNLAAGIALIDTVNTGGDVASKYIDTSKTLVDEARARIEKLKGYAQFGQANLDMAQQEAQTATGFINNATAYMKMADSELNLDKIFNAHRREAEKLMDRYQKALGKLGVISDGAKHNCSRSL